MTDRSFEALPKEYRVDITWKNGFQHGYEQKLTPKQLKSEQERLSNYRWIEHAKFKDLTKSEKDA